MLKFLFGALAAALAAACLLAPASASAQVLLSRRATVVSYYPAPVAVVTTPAPVVTTTYLVPAPVVTYDVLPAPVRVLRSSAYLTEVPVVTSYSYRVPLFRPVRIRPAPVIVYGP